MSVLIEGICVVVKRATIEEKYHGGVTQYAGDCPNNMYCADEHLTAVGFQVLDDAYRWIRRLEIQNLVFIQKGVYRDIAVVEKHRGPCRKCAWLDFSLVRTALPDSKEMVEISVCRLAGTDPGDPAMPSGWSLADSQKTRMRYFKLDGIEQRLQFVEARDNIEVYRDTETGETVHIGRPFGGGDGVRMSYDFLKKGLNLVNPYLPLVLDNMNPQDPATEKGRKDMAQGIGYLKEAVRLHPHSWEVHWTLGKAFQALEDYAAAHKYFKSAYNLQPEDPSTSGALMEACWSLNYHEDAIEVARASLRRWPQDPAWISDYGYSLLRDGQVQRAKKLLQKANRMDPADDHTKRRLELARRIALKKEYIPCREFSPFGNSEF
jgi:hypothetical protein